MPIHTLMKDGSALERLAAIDAAVFDKTGTLTTGEPQVATCEIEAGPNAAVAKALALRSRHPAARALARHIAHTPTPMLRELREVPGQGVEAEVDGKITRLGRMDWVAEIAGDGKAQNTGIGIAFAIADHQVFLSTLTERIRPDARAMLDYFAGRNISTTMLSGDGAEQVCAIARTLQMSCAQAQLKPGDKLAYLKREADAGHKLLMVGDGLNDAPALAGAFVSMAPSSGSDVGRVAADFVFMRESLSSTSFAHHAAVAAGCIVRQNFALAIAYNVLAVPLAMTGQLNPLLAAIAMSTSSIIVVGNSLRLYRLNAEAGPAPRNFGATRREESFAS